MENLLEEYQEALQNVKESHIKAREEDPGYSRTFWYEWVGELKYIVDWLRKGEEPKKKKSRQVSFRKEDTFERLGSVDFFNPYAPDPFEEVEEKIDRERSLKQHG